LAFVPLVLSAQFTDLDAALQNLTRGFGSGDPQAIVTGIVPQEKVMLQFPGLIEENGFFGRDQAAYLLDGLFGKVHPSGFEQQSARKFSAEGQYQITALWTIQVNGKPDTRELYITLKKQGERWAVTSVRSGGK
jgi:hypothetical protein